MIQTFYPYVDEQGNIKDNLIKTFSNSNKMIRQIETGVIYTEAIDIYPCRYTYEETDEKIKIMEKLV